MSEEVLRELRILKNAIAGKFEKVMGVRVFGLDSIGNPYAVLVDTAGKLQVNAVSGSVTADVSDRADRLLGVVYGSQGQKLLQKSSTYELQVDLKALSYGTLPIHEQTPWNAPNLDVALSTRATGTILNPHPVSLASIPNPSNLDVALSTIKTQLDKLTFEAVTSKLLVKATRDWTDPSDYDISDRAARLLGIVYGNLDQLQQRATSKDLYVQIRSGGSEKDPTQIRALTSGDVVDVSDKAARLLGILYGSQGQKLQQKATTFELLTQDTDVRNVMREEDDIHSAFTWEKFMREGLDAHFNCTYSDGTERLGKASDYWTQDSYVDVTDGYITAPSNIDALAVRTKNVYAYPQLTIRAILPSLVKRPINSGVWIGFENGTWTGTGAALFFYVTEDGVTEKLYAIVRGGFGALGGAPYRVEITSLLPANYKIGLNTYGIVLKKNLAEFYINDVIVAIAPLSPFTVFTPINPPPYGIVPSRTPVEPMQTAIIELTNFHQEMSFRLSPWSFRVSSGDSKPPRIYRLYQTGTNMLLAGSVLAAGSVTSHPAPTFGYDGKTLYFKASEAGTLLIEVLMETDNWCTYDSISITANTLASYILFGSPVLTRVTFTPSSYPCTISEAEGVLS